jgi:hypothetical protein
MHQGAEGFDPSPTCGPMPLRPHGDWTLVVLGRPAEFEREPDRSRNGVGRSTRQEAWGQAGLKPKLTDHQKAEAIDHNGRSDEAEAMKPCAKLPLAPI